jgi:outer membrane protein assembly factor BamD
LGPVVAGRYRQYAARVNRASPARMLPIPPALRPLAVAFCLALGVAPAACGGARTQPSDYTEAAELAFARAERAVQRRDYEGARGYFAEVMQTYPYSEYAVLSELRIADCHFLERSFPRAIDGYRSFVRFHPNHPEVAYAEYRTALSYVEQMPGGFFLMPPPHERELRDARGAFAQLSAFLARWGATEYAADAREQLRVVADRLAAHELYVARFYYRRENDVAAALRAREVLDAYPQSTLVPGALHVFAAAMLRQGDVDAGTTALRRLADEYPDSPESRDAAEWFRRHGL